MVIAIDGPSATGKSTTALEVARRLGFTYLDTGAMYRAITFAFLRDTINIKDVSAITKALDAINLEFQTHKSIRILLNGEDVTEKIRSTEVTQYVSIMSALSEVRKRMVKIQRNFAKTGNLVVEGRDIGTVVFPDADYKFFLISNDEERARRRQKDLEQLGIKRSISEITKDLQLRDQLDSTREISPLQKAKDAMIVDTTKLSFNEQVEKILSIIKTKE